VALRGGDAALDEPVGHCSAYRRDSPRIAARYAFREDASHTGYARQPFRVVRVPIPPPSEPILYFFQFVCQDRALSGGLLVVATKARYRGGVIVVPGRPRGSVPVPRVGFPVMSTRIMPMLAAATGLVVALCAECAMAAFVLEVGPFPQKAAGTTESSNWSRALASPTGWWVLAPLSAATSRERDHDDDEGNNNDAPSVRDAKLFLPLSESDCHTNSGSQSSGGFDTALVAAPRDAPPTEPKATLPTEGKILLPTGPPFELFRPPRGTV